ncbi:sensor histidine kinase [Streptomyces sp. NPDC004609]|uniref:sensor histidine kinase n=1 Tax=Streptomyces sp. NPDC004609 TaxID=3364704 RepID=UPI0036C048FC
MSHLRPSAPRPNRREGGRHGRPGTRPTAPAGRPCPVPPPDPRLRPQLLRATVLPTLVVALSGAVAVILTVRAAAPRPSAALWAVLTGSAALGVAAVAAAAMGADRLATSVLNRCAALRRSSERDRAELLATVERLRRGEGPPTARTPFTAPPDGDEFDLLAQELGCSHASAVTAVVEASRLSSAAGDEQKVEVFVNLARRLQSLVHREIQLLDELENQVEDPDLLKGLFHVDHLATRIRRHAENLAVLGGAVSRRQWSNPVSMTEVLRSAIAEVEQYPRVKLVPPIAGTLRGHAVADVIHLLAELVENATLFSAPHTQVLLRAQHVTAGLAVEVEDRGLGMPLGEQTRMNALLADPDQVNVTQMLQDGRIGLFVVSALARRHGIAVRLQSNIYGGVQAILVLPQTLLGTETGGFQHDITPASGRTRRARTSIGQTPLAPPPRTRAPAPQPIPRRYQPPPQAPHPGQQRTAHTPQTTHTPHTTHSTTAAPGPLPVRAEHTDRAHPAPAGPGGPPRAESRPTGHPQPPEPPTGPVRGPAGRPQLPRRRSQEHIVPQLRERPGPRRTDEYTAHDPGLMAAFQRGIGLAEAAQPRGETAHPQPEPHRHDNPTEE